MPNELEVILANEIANASAQTVLSMNSVITSMQATGMSSTQIKAVLMNDLTSGGRLFGGFRSQIRNTVKNGVEYAGNTSSMGAFEDAGIKEFIWVTVGGGKVCADCESRSGQVGTNEFWRTVGRPKSGFSVCQQNCRCQLVASNYKGENLNKPLLTKRKKKPLSITDLKMAGKHKTVRDSAKWIETNIAKKVTFGQIKDIDIANQITASLANNFRKYNLNKLNTVIVSRRGSRWASASGGVLNINSKIFTKEGLKSSYKNSVAKYGSLWKKEYARAVLALEKELDSGDKWSIVIAQRRLDRAEKRLKTINKYQRHNCLNKNNIAGSIIDHEIGHIVHDQFTGAINGNYYLKSRQTQGLPANNPVVRQKWNDEWISIFKKVKKDGSILNISEYSTTNNRELFAESFAMYVGTEKAKLPKIIKDYLDRYLEEFK